MSLLLRCTVSPRSVSDRFLLQVPALSEVLLSFHSILPSGIVFPWLCSSPFPSPGSILSEVLPGSVPGFSFSRLVPSLQTADCQGDFLLRLQTEGFFLLLPPSVPDPEGTGKRLRSGGRSRFSKRILFRIPRTEFLLFSDSFPEVLPAGVSGTVLQSRGNFGFSVLSLLTFAGPPAFRSRLPCVQSLLPPRWPQPFLRRSLTSGPERRLSGLDEESALPPDFLKSRQGSSLKSAAYSGNFPPAGPC